MIGQNLQELSGPLSDAEIYIDDTPGISVTEIRAKCRKLKLEKNIGMVVIDYLQLVQGSNKRNGSREQEISEISRSLKILAKELNVPVIALSQLSRAVEQRPDHRPMLSDLRESGAIEQDADIVMFLYRDDYYNQDSEKKDIAEVILAKHRGGSTGTIELLWLGSYTKFVNLEKRFDDQILLLVPGLNANFLALVPGLNIKGDIYRDWGQQQKRKGETMTRILKKNVNTPFFHIMVQGVNREAIFTEEKDIRKSY